MIFGSYCPTMPPAARRLDFGPLNDTLIYPNLSRWLSVPKGLVAFGRVQSPAQHTLTVESIGVLGSVIYVVALMRATLGHRAALRC